MDEAARIYCVPVLKARSPRSKCWPGWFFWGLSPWLTDGCSLSVFGYSCLSRHMCLWCLSVYPDLLFLDYQLDFMGAHLDGLIAAVATYAAKSHQLHLTLCDPMDCSSPGSSVHGTLQARILKWVTMPSSSGSSQPRGWTYISYISCVGKQVLYYWLHLGSLMASVFKLIISLETLSPNTITFWSTGI